MTMSSGITVSSGNTVSATGASGSGISSGAIVTPSASPDWGTAKASATSAAGISISPAFVNDAL